MTRSAGPERTQRRLGRRAEDAAADWLVRDGWTLMDRNVRVGHLEVDILARRAEVVAVVEVRYRGLGAWTTALDSVDAKKRGRLQLAARHLWDQRLRHDLSIQTVRFDVVMVSFDEAGQPVVERVESAFQGG